MDIDPGARLLALLDLETLDDNLFRSTAQEEGWKRVYGGQVLGQALVAASRTVAPERAAHSLHAYFILPGDPNAPLIYQTERTRDGGSFTTRRVVAIQHGRPIFAMTCSFQVEEAGFEHQAAMPDVPGPEGLANEIEIARAHLERIPERGRAFVLRARAVEVRPVGGVSAFDDAVRTPERQAWFRVGATLPDDAALHRALLAYVSDHSLVSTAAMPHPVSWFNPGFQVASLDHAMWFHAPLRVDEWLLYALDSPRASGARGLARGSIFTRDGVLVASVIQEGLIRQRDQAASVTEAR